MIRLIVSLREDLVANRRSPKGAFVVTMFRIASWIRSWPGPLWIIGSPFLFLYLFVVVWILGIELGYQTRVGRRLVIHHGVGLVVNEMVVIGDDCVLRHGTTIGNRTEGGGCPILENGVDIGANAVLLGSIRIGQGAKIGAATVVLQDIPPGATMVGNPGRIISA
jgi:serine acetyltransferase